MKLSPRLQEFAERNYRLKAKQIEDEHRIRENQIPAHLLTPNGESLRVVTLLPLKIASKGPSGD